MSITFYLPSCHSLLIFVVTIAPSLVTILLLITFAICVYGCCIWEGRKKKDKDGLYTTIQKTEHRSTSSTVLSHQAINRTPPELEPAHVHVVNLQNDDRLNSSNSSSELLINNLATDNKRLKVYRMRLQREASLVWKGFAFLL